MALEYTTKTRKVLKELGLDAQQSKVTIRTKILVSLSMYMSVQAILSAIFNWDNLIKRFQAFESLSIALTTFLVLSHYAVDPGSVGGLLALADENYYHYEGIDISEEEEDFKRQTIKEINFGDHLLEQLLKLECGTVLSTPIMYITYMTLITGQVKITSIHFDKLPLPFAFSQKCSNIVTYAAVYFIQSYFLYSSLKNCYCMYSSMLFATRRVVAEVKLMTMTLNRLDIQFKVDETKYTSAFSNLRMIVGQIIENHNLIYRKHKILNKKVAVTITIVNYGLTFLICITIFSFIKVNNTLSRLKYCSQLVVCALLLYIYSFNGQQLINEGDRIVESLAHFTWYDKPKWFKKTLLLMLTRAQTRLEMKPFGLYVLDLRNFAVVMNAAYSYFNLFNKVS